MTVIDFRVSVRAMVQSAHDMTSSSPQWELGMTVHVHVLRNLPIECLAKSFEYDH